MKAEILPLGEKYNGTEIMIYLDDGSRLRVNLQLKNDHKPSPRQLNHDASPYEGEETYYTAVHLVQLINLNIYDFPF